MLLKYSQTEKRTKINANSKQLRTAGNMKLTVGASLAPRLQRKVIKGFGTKRPLTTQSRILPVMGREEQRTPVDPCDNSNDSGLGFDQHLEFPVAARSTLRFADQESLWANEHPEVKRKKMEIKLESDDANDNFSFSETMSRAKKDSPETGGQGPECRTPGRPAPLQRPSTNVRAQLRPTGALVRRPVGSTSLASQLLGMSRDGKAHLQILCQPEQQHRARYQTEGSRGAVKDRSGNGFPIVKLVGYNKPATLQVFIGTDLGRIAPHMFYQACRVSGKNSTPCVEKKIDGTIVIEVDFEPAKDMTVTCDCVGILKERNVDVEHRFPDQSGARSKKKSTRCRMVFRSTITHPDGSTEILQITSQPIVCTQPPGIPEICKKSLISCSCTGGMELFILGKNFLKDTRVVFQQNDTDPAWEETVQPDKEFLQQTHLVCTVPPYCRCDLVEPVLVRLFVMSSGKTSEPHTFTYTPANNPLLHAAVGSTDIPQPCITLAQPTVGQAGVFAKAALVPAAPMILPCSTKPAAILPGLQSQFLPSDSAQGGEKKEIYPVRLWTTQEEGKSREPEQNRVMGQKMMPPPLLPIGSRRPSSNTRLIIPDIDPAVVVTTTELKTERVDENSQGSNQLSPENLKGIDLRMKPVPASPIATVADLLSTQSPSMATFRRFVSNSTDSPLPAQSASSVENFLSRLENPATVAKSDSVRASAPSVPEILNKIQNSGAIPTAKLFTSTPLIFEVPQQPTQPEAQQKIPFVNDVALSNVFTPEASVNLEKQNSSLQDAFAASIAASLSAVVPGTQGEPMAMLAVRNPLPSVAESQMSGRTTEAMISNIAEPSGIMQTAASLMFSTSQPIATKSIMPNVAITQKNDEQLIDGLSKSVDEQSPSPVCSMLGAPVPVPTHETLNLQASSLLAVAQTGSALLSVTPNSRLDALVSTAMENHILTSDHQAEVTSAEKLNALVNSAVESHMINQCPISISSENAALNTQASVGLSRQELSPIADNEPSPIHVQDLRLESSVSPVSSVNSFHLNSINSSQQSVQDNILSNAVSAALSEHILASGSETKEAESIVLNRQSGQNLTIDTTVSSSNTGNSHMLLGSPTCTSPIAVKTIILNSAVASTVDNQLLIPSPAHNSPIAVKSMILNSPPIKSDLQLPSPNRTSPIAIQSLILNSSSVAEDIHVTAQSNVSPIAIKSILNSAPVNSDIYLPNANCTSPIAMKKLILDSSASVVNEMHTANPNQTSSLNMTNILCAQVSDANLLATAPPESLVQSTINNHILAPTPSQSSTPCATTLCSLLGSSTVPTLLANSPPLIITQAPSVPPTSSTSSSVNEELRPMDQHLTAIFTTNNEANVQSLDFGSGNNSLQPPNCTVPVGQAESLTNPSHFSAGASNSSKLIDLNSQSRNDSTTGFVNQIVMELAAGENIKNQMEAPIITESTISKTIQGSEFLTASNSKVSEGGMFTATGNLKSIGSSGESNLPRIANKLDIAEVAHHQQKQQQEVSSSTALPVPVAEISSASRGATSGGPVQKKCEEGMVPQELTQMSDIDLLSYINPSCFDQV